MKKRKENPGQLILGAHYQNSAAVDDHVLAYRDLAILLRVGEHGATHREYQIIIILYIK